MTPTLAAAASGNLDAFDGAQLVGTIPVRQSLLNHFLQQAIAERRGRVKEIELRVGQDNLIEIGLRIAVGPFAKWFRPQMIVAPQLLTSRGPMIVLTVASNEYLGLMWIAQMFANEYFPRGLRIDGRQITIDVTAMPQSQQARGLFRHLRHLAARTTPGVINIDFDLKVGQS